jgi:hypothetical protein
MKLFIVSLFFIFLSACAQTTPKVSNTYWPQVTIPAETKEDSKERFLSVLTTAGATLVEENSSSLKFYLPIDRSSATVTNALLGSTKSSPPRDVLLLVFTKNTEGTAISAQFWREIQQFNGAWQRFEQRENNKLFNEIQRMLWRARSDAGQAGGLTER